MTSTDTLPAASSLKIDKHALTVQLFGEPLTSTMNKYTRENVRQDLDASGVILMLAHGLGFSGIQNENVFVRSPERLTIWDYAEAFAELYKSGLLGQLDPKKHKVVLCGHSVGSVAVVLATSFFNPSSRLPFSSLILVDPPIWSKKWHGKDNEFYKMVEQMTPTRRDIWMNRREASEWLQSKIARAWDKRVFAKYVEHGVRLLPTAFYPDRQGATLTTHRLAESFCYGKAAKFFVYEALDRLNQICAYVPVHLVYGNRNDMFDREPQNSLVNVEDGRSFASIRRIGGVGHLIPQEKPAELAEEIFGILYAQELKPSFKL
ncbi:hypothetical protein D9619_007549 [Psilocybe cf. subviscida]|uniref:AB hydrolase-1 domain-containing protein n=1 Tax=Psilocybe cf. subviscida TaxID=2480587 RepID=A0A8H5B2F4_9AGAR|nr:hypothetical protein D9619_007549 [Psilocybe cf. subviscida]